MRSSTDGGGKQENSEVLQAAEVWTQENWKLPKPGLSRVQKCDEDQEQYFFQREVSYLRTTCPGLQGFA